MIQVKFSMSANLLNKQEKNSMELLHKILKIYHHLEVSLPDRYQEKSLVASVARILLNLDMVTKSNLVQVDHTIHIQKL
jgi:hypothetical protein